jgi:hypothetical protein
LLFERDGLRVYENTQALPRARYVSGVKVVPDPHELLQRLASGVDEQRRIALVEQEPPSGFVGSPPYDGTGAATFVIDEPEHIVLAVEASQRGFLLLSDHHFPGWQAQVNGGAVPIQSANFLFRLVEVPAGQSRVELRYRPRSLAVGAIVSAVTVATLTLALLRRRITPAARARG